MAGMLLTDSFSEKFKEYINKTKMRLNGTLKRLNNKNRLYEDQRSLKDIIKEEFNVNSDIITKVKFLTIKNLFIDFLKK